MHPQRRAFLVVAAMTALSFVLPYVPGESLNSDEEKLSLLQIVRLGIEEGAYVIALAPVVAFLPLLLVPLAGRRSLPPTNAKAAFAAGPTVLIGLFFGWVFLRNMNEASIPLERQLTTFPGAYCQIFAALAALVVAVPGAVKAITNASSVGASLAARTMRGSVPPVVRNGIILGLVFLAGLFAAGVFDDRCDEKRHDAFVECCDRLGMAYLPEDGGSCQGSTSDWHLVGRGGGVNQLDRCVSRTLEARGCEP